MAITAATTLSNFSGFIPEDIAAPIFDKAGHQSAIMRLAPRVQLAGNGTSVPVTTGLPEADWVSEAGQKPATSGGMSLVSMDPKKLAAIVVVSQEVVRANPGGYVTKLYPQLASAFAMAFDMAAFHNLSGTGHSTGPFTTALTATTQTVTLGTGTTLHNDLVAAGKLLAEDGKSLNGWAFSDLAEWTFYDEVDGQNRPIYVAGTLADAGTPTGGRLLGRPCAITKAAGFSTTMGFAGDWTQCAWGAVGGINYALSTEATVTINGSLVSLFEYNLVAIRAEAEYGFIVSDATASHFVKFLSSGDIGTLGTPNTTMLEG